MSEHLGTTTELIWFSMEMAKQLESHKEEKKSLRLWDYEEVEELVINEVKKRIKIIEHSIDPNEIQKQSIHIANYAMMLYVKSKYNV